ncbi:RagB/SusD family nutrient uptake outer membrane protein [uncultured Pontibacter sp.]|uniref:RagB/SusD family nutrient uptake outer membrane protein n=1 Tax=uncultured Pontibacter sp. TaxID=453356 RepID=UPI002603587E|nr:RagB/SusD family nutrient uptake outer membrane protein [uncultured Pontibacter sp.]
MNKNILTYILLGTLTFGASSCEDILDTEPKQSVSTEVALNTYTGANSTLIGAYNGLQNIGYYGRDFVVISEVLSDNMKVTLANSNRFVGQYNNTQNSHFALWRGADYNAYGTINMLNNVIAAVDNLKDASEEQKSRLKGEALFLRGLSYFDLARVYGYEPGKEVEGWNQSVPLILAPTDKFEAVTYPARNTNSEVYAQVIKDLNDAAGLLGAADYPTRATSVAAHALLSRVYLYIGEWQKAVDAADIVINARGSSLVTDPTKYATIFKSATSPESIFELNFESNENQLSNSIQSIYMRNGNDPNGAGYGDLVPTENLLADYEQNDARKSLLVPVKKGSENVFWNQKYAGSKGAYGLDNIKIIRIAEVYLNRAEALAELSRLEDARKDLNKIRSRAGLAVSTTDSKAELIAEVLKERRVELAYEGHRWFDLKRRALTATKAPEVPYTDYRILANIPTLEIDTNPNIKPNPKY